MQTMSCAQEFAKWNENYHEMRKYIEDEVMCDSLPIIVFPFFDRPEEDHKAQQGLFNSAPYTKYQMHGDVLRYQVYRIRPDVYKDPVIIHLFDNSMFMKGRSSGPYTLKGRWAAQRDAFGVWKTGMQITLDGFQWMDLLPENDP